MDIEIYKMYLFTPSDVIEWLQEGSRMKNVYMTGFKVQGIKTIDQPISLSFYKKTIKKPIDTQDYNIKGIYGMNGSGKTGIVTAVDILRKLIISDNYLNNPVVQKSLEGLINKKTKKLSIELEYLADINKTTMLYRYSVNLKKSLSDRYVIGSESLCAKTASSNSSDFMPLIKVNDGEIVFIDDTEKDAFPDSFKERTKNLLGTSSLPALFFEKIVLPDMQIKDETKGVLFVSLYILLYLGHIIYVYMDQSDDHTDYSLNSIIKYGRISEFLGETSLKDVKKKLRFIDRNRLNVFSIDGNIVPSELFDDYTNAVKKLQKFIQVFKPDLARIDIDKKIDGENYICDLLMVYDSYSIATEFESTGVKKLIKLFAYLREMAQGGIVFIDEFDSNLHDVYLCALLEYLMDYGEGQLCFTTHNVSPMEILKRHKMSIDFLSLDHKISSWKTNGNYSPSKLYRKGMIEGLPFNVDSTDFIGILDSLEEVEE